MVVAERAVPLTEYPTHVYCVGPSRDICQIHSVGPLLVHRAAPLALRQRSSVRHHLRPGAGPAWPYLQCAAACRCTPARTCTTTLRRSQPGVGPAPQPPVGIHSLLDFWRFRWHQFIRHVFVVFGARPGGSLLGAPQGAAERVRRVRGDT